MRNVFLFSCLSLYAAVATAQLRDGLLPIDEAYKITTEVKTPGVLTVHYQIAPDYYLYRGRMRFISGKDTILGEPKLPDGTQYHDQYLGDVETYHNSVDAIIPFTAAAGAKSIHLTLGYQGCHEVKPKLCYPPHLKAIDVALSGASATGAIPTASADAPTVADSEAPSTAAAVGAARYNGTPAARALLKSAKDLRDAGNFDDALVDYKKAVKLDPNYADAQFEYLMAERSRYTISMLYGRIKKPVKDLKAAEQQTRKQDKVIERQLISEYEGLMAKHPHDAIYPYALGLLYNETKLAKEEALCQKAVDLDKDFAQAHMCLGELAQLHTHEDQAIAHVREAARLAPDNEQIAEYYAYLLSINGEANTPEIATLVQRFPDSMGAAMALTDEANSLTPESARVAELEKLRKAPPGGSQPVVMYASEHLYATYMADDLPKAKALADDMSTSKKYGRMWAPRATYVAALIKAQSDLAAGQAQSALAALKSVESQKDEDPAEGWYLTQAKALEAAGKPADAAAVLRDRFVAFPTDALYKAMIAFGEKSGATEDQVNKEIWRAFQAKTKPAAPFTLKRLDNGQPLSLSDYRGHVVIVDFWYPNCGPCRASFPYLQKLAAKFKDKGMTVLAITSIAEQQDFALPYLRGKGYDFIGLAGNEKFAQDVYGVQGYPTTFLIGADGKVYAHLELYDDAHERSAETAIRFLLTHAKS